MSGSVNVVARRGKAIGQASTIDEQVHAEFVAYRPKYFEFCKRIDRARFGGERDVRHARHRDVLGHGTFRIALGNGAQIGSGELAVARGNRFAFVADMLGCARLVNIDMPAIGAHDTLPRAKRMCDERDVGLCSAYDVVHRGIWACSRLLYERAGPLAPFVELIARIRFRIRHLQRLENFRYRAMAVVVIQSNHECTSFLQTLPSYKKAEPAGNLACSLSPAASFAAMRDSMTERSATR